MPLGSDRWTFENRKKPLPRGPHCGRTFNKEGPPRIQQSPLAAGPPSALGEAGERHIAICLKTFGKKLGKPRPGRPGRQGREQRHSLNRLPIGGTVLKTSCQL